MWLYQDTELLGVPEGYIGFVYLITRIRDGKFYVGKKNFFTKVTKPPLKGMKRKRRSQKESDWRTYFGSSAELASDLAQDGPEAFKREILHLCTTKGELSYLEAKEQFERDVLRSSNCYNGWITCKVARNHLP